MHDNRYYIGKMKNSVKIILPIVKTSWRILPLKTNGILPDDAFLL